MTKNNIVYHNVDELLKTPLGDRLSRYPEYVVEQLNPRERFMARYACGCELRFVTDAPRVLLTLYGSGNITVYCGDYCYKTQVVQQPGVFTMELERPFVIENGTERFFEKNVFSKEVWRVCFHNGIITVCDIDAMGYALRMPLAEELPKQTMLAYGSSITHGAGAQVYSNCYVSTLARLLGADCLNKGVGGSCHAERIIAESFAQRKDWDFALLELGVNMDFEQAEFKKRFDTFIDIMADTGKKLLITTIYKNFAIVTQQEEVCQRLLRYNEIIRDKVSRLDAKQCLLLEGEHILEHTEYLTTDGIHPSTEGHVMMGMNLYHMVKGFL